MSSRTSGDERLLALMRHATAEPIAATDRTRPLAPNGPAQARAAARWAHGLGFAPDHVLVSDALRAQGTARAAVETWQAVGADEPLWDQNQSVYEAGPEALLDLVRQVPVDTRHLLVVGHNPAIAQLAQLLDSGEGLQTDPRAGFPPASLVLLRVPNAWLDLALFGAPVLAVRHGDEPRTR